MTSDNGEGFVNWGVSRHLMNIPQELRILILQLVAKHPSLKDDYSLTRFFAKSSILPDKLHAAKDDMVECGLMLVEDTRNTVKHYRVTTKGLTLLSEHNLIDYLSSFALQIDKSEFILKIINLLEKNAID
jgi:hypothetical protein